MNALRFVALGDSVTVGVGDPMPDGSWRGWARLLAETLAAPGAIEFHNLATLGARARDVAEQQLPAALHRRPTIAAVFVGVNDTLRSTYNIEEVGRYLTATVEALCDIGAVVLTARLPDPGRMFGLPVALARPLARRIRAINAITDFIAQRHRTVHFDAANHPATYGRPMWSVDRLHPSERGHRLIAAEYADLLMARGFPIYARPSVEPSNPPPNRRGEVVWMVTKGTAWLYKRCHDLLPDLIHLAAIEWWHQRRGSTERLDERVSIESGRVLAQLRISSAGSAPPNHFTPRV